MSSYSIRDIRRALQQPELLLGECSRIATQINAATHRTVYPEGDGHDVLDDDWDTLVILDGCRYDTFRDVHDFPGRLERRRSKGSESWEYLRHNFAGRSVHDTVYVTSNPHAEKLPPGTFHAIINLLDDCWDAELETVPPGPVTERAIEAHREYPQKRLIIHYMQPHFPFIGPTGRQMEQKGISMHREETEHDSAQAWVNLRYGRVERELVQRAYTENLELVFPHVRRLLEAIDGRTVITSDHGNLMGERTWPIPFRQYGHPGGLRVPALREVPWHVVETTPRPNITTDPPVERHSLDDEFVEERLHDLGYR